MQVLEDLWSRDFRPEKPYIHNKQYAEAQKSSDACEKTLEETFSEEQQTLFEEYRKARDELALVTDCETYITGFKLGYRSAPGSCWMC